METIQFGSHITIDGYGGNPYKLNDRNLVLKVLNELPNKLGMTKLGEPMIHRYTPETENSKDPGGWSGVVMINESHISIHTFTKRKFLTADVYTCKGEIDSEYILDYFKVMFDLEDIETHSLDRGTRYPSKNLV